MSSVWYEEIDKALLNFIRENITILDRKNNKRVYCPCKVRLPEKDGEINSMPCITISHISEMKDYTRYNWQGYYSSQLNEDNTIEQRLPKKYNITFQIDLWSNYMVDNNDLTMQWADKFDNKTSLLVIDNEGQEVLCEMYKVGYNFGSDAEDNKRTFKSSYLYTIWVTIDEDQNINKKVAEKINLHITKKV